MKNKQQTDNKENESEKTEITNNPLMIDKKNETEAFEAPSPLLFPVEENQNQKFNNENEKEKKFYYSGLKIEKEKEEKHSEFNSSGGFSTKSDGSAFYSEEEISNYEKYKKNKPKKQYSDNNIFKPKDNNFYSFASNVLNKCEIDLSVIKKDNKNDLVINKVTIGLHNIIINVDKFRNYLKSSMEIKKNNNDIMDENSFKFTNFIKEFEERIVNEYNNNFELNLKIQTKKTDKGNINNYFNLEAIYTFYQPLNGKTLKYIDENILINGTESKMQGFNFMITDLNQEKFKNINNIENNISNPNDNIKQFEKEKNNNKINLNSSSINEFIDINKKANDETILEIIKIIEKKNNYNGLIAELHNGFFIYLKNDNSIAIIDNKYNQVVEIKDYDDEIKCICELAPKELNKQNEENYLKFVILGNKKIYQTTVDLITLKYEIKQLNVSHLYSLNCIEIEKNNILILGKNMTSYYINLFNDSEKKEFQINLNKSYFNSIKVNENVVAIISNGLYPNGDDVLHFFNLKEKKLLNEIKGYSFIISQNGMTIMSKLDKEKNKILLCACKQYTKGQKNGILLVNFDPEDNKQFDKIFYNSGDIEIHCFCPILNIDNGEKNKATNYFFVGGFDQKKRKGVIQLFKINFGKKVTNKTIEYIQDIKFKSQKGIDGFNGPINCLKQSKRTGNILACCYNGNIYLLTPPNINYYLEEDSINNLKHNC